MMMMMMMMMMEISTMVLRGEVMKRNLKLRVRLLVMMNTTMLLMLVYC